MSGDTVHVLGQYVLSGPIVAVHLFSKRAPLACTARHPLAGCMLGEQMYCYVRDAKSLLECKFTVSWESAASNPSIEATYILVALEYNTAIGWLYIHTYYIHIEDKWMASSPHERITHARSLKNGTVPKRWAEHILPPPPRRTRRARDQWRPFNNETGSSLSAIMRCIKLHIRQKLYASEVYTLIQIDFQHMGPNMIAILFIDRY